MSEELLIWFEIIFDVLYLVTIWTLVVYMWVKRGNLKEHVRRIGILVILAFFLLALGDTGHVGFRVVAYLLGELEDYPTFVGLGALSTAITVTFFYMIVAEIWRLQFDHKRDVIWWGLILSGVIRLGIMIPSGNDWGSVVPPLNWSLARNIPLVIQGLGIAGLLLFDSIKHKDSFAKWMGIFIVVSYACYLPVILFVQQVPMLGMLMIPKTLAYVAVAVLALRLFQPQEQSK